MSDDVGRRLAQELAHEMSNLTLKIVLCVIVAWTVVFSFFMWASS